MGRELEVKNYDTDKRTHAYYHLFAVRPVEAFDEGVLIGLAGLNVAEADPLRRTPLDEGFGNELGAIVDAHPSRAAIEPHELVQHPNDPGAGDGGADLDRQRLPIALIDDREGPEGTAVVQGINHEIEGPCFVQALRGEERLPQAHRYAALCPPRQVQAERAVYAMHALMVPAMPRAPEAIETLPESPAAMAGHDVVQGGHHVGIPPQPRPRRPVVRRPRQPHRLARPAHGHVMLVHQHCQDFAFRGRRHRFRLRTSLMAAFSRASSAYIRLSLAFSASSSFSRLSSASEAPAYFARH